MSNETSCIGCKYLYAQDTGYSNYTVLDTEMRCAICRNPELPKSEPYDWNKKEDNWDATKAGRCERYLPGPEVHLDCDHEDTVESQTDDPDARAAICSDSGAEK